MAKKKNVNDIQEREGVLTVSRTVLNKEGQKATKIKVRPFVTQPASVSVKYGQTIPTVPYGNVRVDVMLTCPAYVEEILEVYKEVRDMVDKLMDEEAARFGVGRDKAIK